jgi:catechol 2,3-dioxygenase-like lactoylglutathione lyase family enzyme
MTAAAARPPVPIAGVHHTARPTWKLGETIRFYRDVLGLPLVHAISARGWGTDDHADFLHFFFDAGAGATIAFFYYIGAPKPDYVESRDDYRWRASHTAWRVETREQLLKCREQVEAAGVKVKYQIRHEVIESIYFDDPNGYPIEITWQVRPFGDIDVDDARRTMEAAMALEAEAAAGTAKFGGIDAVWQRKARTLAADLESA